MAGKSQKLDPPKNILIVKKENIMSKIVTQLQKEDQRMKRSSKNSKKFDRITTE